MGSKIRPPGTSMGPFFSKTWYFDGSIFQNFLKFAPKWRKFGTLIGQLFKIFRNLRQNGANFSEKFWFLVHGWVTFPSKWVHGWVAFQKIPAAHPYPDPKLSTPPRGCDTGDLCTLLDRASLGFWMNATHDSIIRVFQTKPCSLIHCAICIYVLYFNKLFFF